MSMTEDEKFRAEHAHEVKAFGIVKARKLEARDQRLSGDNEDCTNCDDKIALTDVEGHYSGRCRACRGGEGEGEPHAGNQGGT